MKENQRKIEEQQKKMVSLTARGKINQRSSVLILGGRKTQDDRGTNENRRGKAKIQAKGGEKSKK